MKQTIHYAIISVLLLILNLSLCVRCFSQKKQDTSLYKNVFSIDLIPVYYDCFDTRKQIRIGLEYDRRLGRSSFISGFLDAGLFDDYSFMKYYDFFNPGTGLYSVETNAAISGFHFLPGYNYYIIRSKKRPNRGIYCGGNFEFNYYHKKLESRNSSTGETLEERYHQWRLGGGLSLGGSYGFGRHFFLELKTYFGGRIYQYISTENVNPVKPLNAFWSDRKNNFWWTGYVKIGYAF